MKENTKEKALILINENSIFYKIKNFFKKLFGKKDNINSTVSADNIPNIVEERTIKDTFIQNIKNISSEETELLKLQKQYRIGEIQENDLTEEQINSLSTLYDTQILNLKKSNEARKQKLLNYRMNLQTDN